MELATDNAQLKIESHKIYDGHGMKQRIALDQGDGNRRRCRSAKYDGSTIEVVSRIQFHCRLVFFLPPQRDGKGGNELDAFHGEKRSQFTHFQDTSEDILGRNQVR